MASVVPIHLVPRTRRIPPSHTKADLGRVIDRLQVIALTQPAVLLAIQELLENIVDIQP